MVKRFFCLFIGFWLLTAQAVVPERLTLNAPVIDQAGLLTSSENTQLSAMIRHWHQQGLMQAAVVIVDSTDGMAPFDYAMSLAERWKLGSKQQDNGLLFLIAVGDRTYFILPGYGLEGALPDVSIKRIERNQLVPSFKGGRYFQGIDQTLKAIATQLEADPEIRSQMIAEDKKDSQGDLLEELLPFFIPIFIVTMVLRAVLGRFLGSLLGSGVVFGITVWSVGAGIVAGLFFALFFFVFVQFFSGMNRRGGGIPIIVSGRNDRGGFGGGGFGGGGGYSGGGGGFSGGGAGGSW